MSNKKYFNFESYNEEKTQLREVRVKESSGSKSYSLEHSIDAGKNWKKSKKNLQAKLYSWEEISKLKEKPIFWTEGASNAQGLIDLGISATSLFGGAKTNDKWFTSKLKADLKLLIQNKCTFVICADYDEVGKKHALILYNTLKELGTQAQLFMTNKFSKGGDIIDLAKSLDNDPKKIIEEVEKSLQSSKDILIYKSLIGVDASKIVEKELQWFIYPYFAEGTLVALTGAPGSSKSMFSCWLASKFSRGGKLFGNDIEKSKVLLCSLEDDPAAVTLKRLKANGADLTRIRILDELSCVGDEVVQKFKTLKHELGIKVFIIDPLVAVLGRGLDMNQSNHVRDFLTPILNFAKEENVLVLLVRHSGKDSSAKAANKGLGSIDFTAAVRSELLLEAPESLEKNERVISHVKTNYGIKGSSIKYKIAENGKITDLEETDYNPDSADSSKASKVSAGAQCLNFVLASLHPNKKIDSKTFFERSTAAGLGKRTMEEILSQFCESKKTHLVGQGRGASFSEISLRKEWEKIAENTGYAKLRDKFLRSRRDPVNSATCSSPQSLENERC